MYIHTNKTMTNSTRLHWLAAFLLLFTIFSLSFSSAFCKESWMCQDWQKCSDNSTIRNCFDINGCNTVNEKPNTIEDCSVVFPDCYDELKDNSETDIDCGGSICMQCQENQNCLKNEDCSTLYCNGEGKGICSIETSNNQQPAPLTADYAYFIFFILAMSSILVAVIINQINREMDSYLKNEFSINLSSYLEKKEKNRENEFDTEIDLEVSIPEKQEKRIEKNIQMGEEKRQKEAKKWLDLDGVKVNLPAQLPSPKPKFHYASPKSKKEKEGMDHERKKAILNGLKHSYE